MKENILTMGTISKLFPFLIVQSQADIKTLFSAKIMKTTLNIEKFTDKTTVKITLKSNGNYQTYHFDTQKKALDFYNLKNYEYYDAYGEGYWKIELL